MIEVLGARRVTVIAGLALVNALLGAATYLYVLPQKDKTDQELRTVRAEISQRRDETEKMHTQLQQIEEQKELFAVLQKSDFFGEQDRYNARRTIEAIQTQSSVLSARYTIGAAQQEDTEKATEAGQQLMVSPIEIAIEAMDDIDVYNFVYWIENAFPGHVGVDMIELTRKGDLSEAVLRQIGSGSPVTLIDSKVGFTWRTMVPKAGGDDAGGAQ